MAKSRKPVSRKGKQPPRKSVTRKGKQPSRKPASRKGKQPSRRGAHINGVNAGATEEPLPVVTLNDPEDCPFLRLPAEIRNQIYNCVLGGCQINVNLNDYGLWRRPQRQPYYITTIPWQPNTMIALTKVCRQIHQDTALLPFKLNTFGEAIALKVEIFRRFVLGRSNEQRAAIRTITFSFDTIIWNEAAQVFFEHNSRWEKTTGLDLLPGLRKIIFQHMDLSKFSLAQQEWFINMGREYFRGKAVELVEAGTGRKDVKIAYEGDDSETGWTWKDGKFFTTHKTPSSDLKSANGGVV